MLIRRHSACLIRFDPFATRRHPMKSSLASFLVGLLAVPTIVGSAAATATRPETRLDPLASHETRVVSSGVCTLEPGPLSSNSQYFPGDPWTAVATRLHPSTCTASCC